MNRLISVLAVLGATLAVQAAPPPQSDQRVARPGVVVIEGHVAEVAFNQRLLRVAGQTLAVPIGTPVHQERGGSYSFSLLQPGQAVRVAYERQQGRSVVDELWVLAPGQAPEQY